MQENSFFRPNTYFFSFADSSALGRDGTPCPPPRFVSRYTYHRGWARQCINLDDIQNVYMDPRGVDVVLGAAIGQENGVSPWGCRTETPSAGKKKVDMAPPRRVALFEVDDVARLVCLEAGLFDDVIEVAAVAHLDKIEVRIGVVLRRERHGTDPQEALQ